MSYKTHGSTRLVSEINTNQRTSVTPNRDENGNNLNSESKVTHPSSLHPPPPPPSQKLASPGPSISKSTLNVVPAQLAAIRNFVLERTQNQNILVQRFNPVSNQAASSQRARRHDITSIPSSCLGRLRIPLLTPPEQLPHALFRPLNSKRNHPQSRPSKASTNAPPVQTVSSPRSIPPFAVSFRRPRK